jgi:hypothetical protein
MCSSRAICSRANSSAGANHRLRSPWRRVFSVRFWVSSSTALISSPAAATSEASTHWARVALERFDRVDGLASDMGASRDC